MARKKKSNWQLQKEAQQLRKRIRELENWQVRFSDLQRRVSNFTHDLKSPVLCNVAFANRLKRRLKNLTTEDTRIIEQLINSTRLVEDIVKSLDELTTIGESPLKIVSFDIQEVFDSIRANFFDDLTKRKIALIVPGESIPIEADRVRFIRVFNNFFSNALKYGGSLMNRIKCTCKDNGDFWLFTFWNNGDPLSEEDCERIFDPYFRQEKTCEGIEGTGIGLSIVRRIAERHGGSSWAVPGKKRGMYFYFKILKNPPKPE